MQQVLDIVRFQPDVYIEIDDSFTGTRKLGRVTETGTAYVDLLEEDATAFPNYAHLKPAEVGNILGWGLYLIDKLPEEHAPFRALVDRLIASGEDALTYNRAAHWAFSNHNYDYDQALAAGRAATDRVRQGRRLMDKIVRNAEGATK